MAVFANAFLVFCLCFLSAAPSVSALDGYVVRVEEGGTVVISENKNLDGMPERYLFYGVDVPTLRQPFGEEALAWLRDKLPEGGEVSLESVSKDGEGNLRALIQSDGASINYQLLYDGFAWVNRGQCRAIFCRRWYIQEHQAVVEKRGIWSIPMPTPPWQWER